MAEQSKLKWFEIGQVYREHGIRGALSCRLHSGSSDNLPVGQKVLLQTEGKKLETKVLKAALHGQKFLVSFEGLRNPEEAALWRQALILVGQENLKAAEGNEFYLEKLAGFEVIESVTGKVLGTVMGIRGSASVSFFSIQTPSGHEVLLPLETRWLQSVDAAARQVRFDLPDGLWEALQE